MMDHTTPTDSPPILVQSCPPQLPTALPTPNLGGLDSNPCPAMDDKGPVTLCLSDAPTSQDCCVVEMNTIPSALEEGQS